MLEFTSNATHMQQVCNKDYDMYRTFSEQSGNVLLRVSTSGATDSEYVEMMLASIETYLLDGIARQRDMSKIALQSANGTDCLSNSINRIYKLLYIKVCVHFLCQSHSTGVSHNLFDYCLIYASFG